MQRFMFSNAKKRITIIADNFGDAVEKLPADFLDDRQPSISVTWSPVTLEYVQELRDRVEELERQLRGMLTIPRS